MSEKVRTLIFISGSAGMNKFIFHSKILFGRHRKSAPHNLYRFFSLNSLLVYDLSIDTYDILIIQSLLERGPMVHFKMVSAVKLTTSEFNVPIRAGSLDFSERYLCSHLFVGNIGERPGRGKGG